MPLSVVALEDTVTYRVEVANAGPSDALAVVVADTLPLGVTLVSAVPSQGSCDESQICQLGTIPAGGSAGIDLIVRPDVTTTGAITNAASVASVTSDPDTTHDTDTEDTDVLPADIRLGLATAIVAGDAFQAVGESIAFEYVLTNTGNVTLSAPFTVADDHITVPDAVVCPVAPTELAPGESITCTATYTVTQADLDAGSVTSTAIASALDPLAGSVISDPASVTAARAVDPIVPFASEAEAAGVFTYLNVGDVISYAYQLTNNGNVTLYGPFTVDDDRTGVTCPASPTCCCLGNRSPAPRPTRSPRRTSTRVPSRTSRRPRRAPAPMDRSSGRTRTTPPPRRSRSGPSASTRRSSSGDPYAAVGDVITLSLPGDQHGQRAPDGTGHRRRRPDDRQLPRWRPGRGSRP